MEMSLIDAREVASKTLPAAAAGFFLCSISETFGANPRTVNKCLAGYSKINKNSLRVLPVMPYHMFLGSETFDHSPPGFVRGGFFVPD